MANTHTHTHTHTRLHPPEHSRSAGKRTHRSDSGQPYPSTELGTLSNRHKTLSPVNSLSFTTRSVHRFCGHTLRLCATDRADVQDTDSPLLFLSVWDDYSGNNITELISVGTHFVCALQTDGADVQDTDSPLLFLSVWDDHLGNNITELICYQTLIYKCFKK